MIAPKSTQKYQEKYRLIVQLALMAAASSKTEMTPCGHVFPDRDYHTWPFELIQAFRVVLVTCKNEEDPIKNEGARMLTRFSPLQVYGNFFSRSRAVISAVLGRIWLKFELVRDIIDVLVTCKYEEDPIKMKALEC